jgi:8-hydroxy-5-deazaflavin:NADPH oxidoreductase
MYDDGSGKIGILGAGPVGVGLATLLAEQGYQVVTSSRSPAERQAELDVPVVGFAEAAAHGEVVVLAVTHDAVEGMVAALRPHLAGKVVVDVTNAVEVHDGRLRNGLGEGVTEGVWLAGLLPDSTVVRAFNHVQDEMLVSRARRQPGRWAVAVAGDDGDATAMVSRIVSAVGFVPVLIGGLRESGWLDPGGVLFPHMYLPNDMRDALTLAGHPQLP